MKEPPIVLYAEDDENDALFMRRAFAKLNWADALRIVPNGKEAIDYLSGEGAYADRAQHPLPTLLILDVKLPGMSGLEVLTWLRAHPVLGRLAVVMFTSTMQASDVAYSRKHGANAYLVKPAQAEHLAVLMKDLIDAASSMTNAAAPLPLPGNKVIAR
jgi:CheY-like chemotaxis protein